MTEDIYPVGENTTIHVYEGMSCVDIYEKGNKIPTFVTGFPRLDNELKKGPETEGADRDGDVLWKEFEEADNPINKELAFRYITEEMTNLYLQKNADYGDSFTESLDEDGLLVSKIRMKDKLKRFSQLIENDALVDDESMEDTLIDLANYTVMTLMWVRDNEQKS